MTCIIDVNGNIKVTPGVHDHASTEAGGQSLQQIQELNFDDATILTIDGAGAVARTQVYHIIAANAGAADDLDNATGGIEGDELVIRPDTGDTITVRHNQGGADDFWFTGGADIVLDNQDHLRCVHDGTSWCDQSGGAGGAGNTLDQAYDEGGAGVGRTITADAGAVQIIGAGGLYISPGLLDCARTVNTPVAHLEIVTATTDTCELVLTLTHYCAFDPDPGFGARLLYRLVNTDDDREEAAAIDGIWTDGTDGAEESYLRFLVRKGGPALSEVGQFDRYSLRLFTDIVVDMDERVAAAANPDAGRWRLYPKSDGMYQLDDAGVETPLFGGAPQHYRDGVLPYFVDATNIRVTAGDIDVDGSVYEEDSDTAIIDITAGASYIGGVSQQAANTWLYVYVYNDAGTGWAALLYDEPPIYPECAEARVFTAQCSAEEALGAVVIDYDNDVGEDDVGAKDFAAVWTDATFDTWRGAWRVVSINTVADQLTVEANNLDAADNDWITIVHGVPRYRYVGTTWYRCVGALRLNAAQNILEFYRNMEGTVTYAEPYTNMALNAGGAVAYTDVDVSAWVPPNVSTRMIVIEYVSRAGATGKIYTRMDGSAVTYQVTVNANEKGFLQALHEVSPNGAIEYYVANALDDGYLYVAGWVEEL